MRMLLALSIITMALAGCTGSGGDNGNGNGGDEYVTPPQNDQGHYIIGVGGDAGLGFTPEKAKVPVGATVLFTNEGGFHNVVADDGSFNSGQADASDWGYTYTFETAGEFGYHCEPHKTSGMVGTILVEEAMGS